METITLNGSGNGSEAVTTQPGSRYRVRWIYNAATPSAGTLGIYHGAVALATSSVARDTNGNSLTHDLTSVLTNEATIIACATQIVFDIVGADPSDPVLVQCIPLNS